MKKNLLLILISIFSVPAFGQLLITGVCDGDLPGGLPKAVEFFTLEAIPDLSLYGVTSANNGNGNGQGAPVDTIEWNFPAISVPAGGYYYLTTDSASFRDYFGMNATWAVNLGPSTPASVNGDDAIVLMEGTMANIIRTVDVFGETLYTTPPDITWEYRDGWAYRNDNTGPDGGTFVESNWTTMNGALDGFTTNAAATNPWPLGTYSNPTGIATVDAQQFLKILNNPIANELRFTIAHNQSELVNIRIVDLLGKTIQVERKQLNQGSETFSMDVSTLSRGIYFLSIEQGKDTVVRKWIKQ